LQQKAIAFFKIRGWLGCASAGVFSGILANILPLHIRDGLGFTERTAGTVLLFRGLASLAGFSILARFSFWHFNRRWFPILQGALIVSALLFLVAGNILWIYVVLVCIYGFLYAGSYNNSLYHSSADGKEPEKNMATHEIFLACGTALGSMGGGLCYQYLGFAATFVILALVLFVVLLVLTLRGD
jgi:predicted MFS family arabinose efflux permease